VAVARKQVKQERADYTKKLTDVETTLATKASTDAVNAIGTDVNGVKTDLDATKGSLQQLRGEHGELIARNHEELEQLKRMGERDYFEFTLSGKGQKAACGQHAGGTARRQREETPVYGGALFGRHAAREEEQIHQRTHLLLRERIAPTDGTRR